MEPNIADLLKDAFSEIDLEFNPFQSDEGTDAPQTQPLTDKDMDVVNGASELSTTSEQDPTDTLTNVCEKEQSDESSDDSELTSEFTVSTESPFCLPRETDSNQIVNMMMTEAQLKRTAGECTGEEGNMQSDLAAGASLRGLVTELSTTGDEMQLTEEEHMETSEIEYLPKTSPSMSSDSQTPEETSESETDEESPENSNTTERSVDKKDEPSLAMNPNTADKAYVRDDMKEFTEEDQEQIEESLADYPSDLSHSETEEPAENATAQPFTLIDITSSGECPTARMEHLFNAEHVRILDHNSRIEGVEVEMPSELANLDDPFQRGNSDDEDVQEPLTDDRNTKEDAMSSKDAQDLSDINNPADHISDSSSDDRSTSEEETHFLSSVKQEEETDHVTHHEYSPEDMVRMDDDIDYVIPDTMDGDVNSPEMQNLEDLLSSDIEERDLTNTNAILHDDEFNTGPAELHSCVDSVRSDTDKSSSEASYNVGDTKNIIPEALWSSALLMDEDNLCLDEYDWDLTGEESFKIIPGNSESQEYTEEEAQLGIDDDEEENERDWELEKTRIEAFYRFYGDQGEPEDKVGRNHKVTFRLDHESSESDDEESDSTEEELDSDLNTPDLNTLKPEYHSESDDPLEKPYYPERSRMQPKEPQPVNAEVKQHPHKNKCLAVLKSTLAFGLLTAIGVVSFWWATENLDWIH